MPMVRGTRLELNEEIVNVGDVGTREEQDRADSRQRDGDNRNEFPPRFRMVGGGCRGDGTWRQPQRYAHTAGNLADLPPGSGRARYSPTARIALQSRTDFAQLPVEPLKIRTQGRQLGCASTHRFACGFLPRLPPFPRSGRRGTSAKNAVKVGSKRSIGAATGAW
jgi:hypothetical protein